MNQMTRRRSDEDQMKIRTTRTSIFLAHQMNTVPMTQPLKLAMQMMRTSFFS